jgi:sugar phosphate permease
MLAQPAPRRIHYAWIIAAMTFFVLIVTAGVRSTPSVLMIPLEHEFGWSRPVVSLAVSINIFLYGLCGPFAAALMDKFGMRRVVLAALLLIAAATALTTQMHAAWQLYLLWGLLIGLGTGATASVLGAVVANRWFVLRRGLVVGLLTASNATGQLVFLPVLASLAVNTGWRTAALTTTGATLLIAIIVALFMRDSPREIGLKPYGAAATDEEPQPHTGNPFAAAIDGLRRGLRSRDFWLLAGSFFICGASTNGLIGTHLIPASMEHGIPEVTAASLLAVMGIFDLLGTTASGWLSDRMDNRWLLCWYYSLRGISLMFLPYVLGSSYIGLAAFVVFYGLDWIATVPPTVRLAADSFGKRNVGIVYGWISASHQLGAATMAFAAGTLRSLLGSYQVSFISAGLLCLIAAGMVIRIGRNPQQSAGERRREPEIAAVAEGI